jgi:hypothetical protein
MFPGNTQNTQTALSKIPEVLAKANSGVIILPMNPTQDAVAAATSLYLGLTKLGKNVTLACSSPVQYDLLGVDKIQNNLSTGGDNLVISFPFQEDSLDKVDYGFQGNFFNIIVTPRPGQPKLEPNKVKFSYTGGSLDFIITVDSPNLQSLGQLYQENQNDFNGKTIINIDRHLVNDLYGVVNYVNKTSSSSSELVFRVLEAVHAEIDKDMATNLYAGLSVATNNFTSYSVNADTFEVAAALLKRGALKRPPTRGNQPSMNAAAGIPPAPYNAPQQPQQQQAQQQPQPQNNPPMRRQQFSHNQGGFQNQPQRTNPAPQQFNNQNQQQSQHANKQFTFPQASSSMKEVRPIEDVERVPTEDDANVSAPQDWLKPKIFRGGGII